MQNIEFVQTFQSHHNLNKHPPYILFLKLSVGFLVLNYLLIEVSIVGELHNNATLWKILPQGIGFDKGMLVAYDVGAFY